MIQAVTERGSMSQRILIVGGGVAGLSAGCYARMNGYDATVFEQHTMAGGLCTAWRRQGFLFDGCIHFLVGSNPQSPLHRFWAEVGAGDFEYAHHDVNIQLEDGGRVLTLWADPERLRQHMLELSTQDAAPINEFCDAVAHYPQCGRLRGLPMEHFSAEFRDPFLRKAMGSLGNLDFLLLTQAAYARRDAGFPLGGSLQLAHNLEQRFLALGGQLRTGAKVACVLVEGDRAVGVRLSDGTEHRGDRVISTAGFHPTVYGLLEGRYVDENITALTQQARVFPSSVQVSLGFDCDLSGEPHEVMVFQDQPLRLAGADRPAVYIKHYGFDRVLCPPGKAMVTTVLISDYHYWKSLREDPAAYRAEKEQVAQAFTRIVEQRFPQARGRLRVVDVATPLTYERYTDAWQGAYMGWQSTPEFPVRNVPSTLPGLRNFAMAGQWTYAGGGLPVALMSARGALQRICAEEGREFVTTTA